MGIYARGNVLWLRYQDATGKWRDASSGYRKGEDAKAEEMLAVVESEIAKQRAQSIATTGAVGLTIRVYAAKWLEAARSRASRTTTATCTTTSCRCWATCS